MAKQTENEAPFGYDVISGVDGSRVHRNVSKDVAEETRRRIVANGFDAEVEPSEEPLFGGAAARLEPQTDDDGASADNSDDGDGLDDLTVDELDKLAEKNDVADYKKSDNKDDKLSALRAAGVSA